MTESTAVCRCPSIECPLHGVNPPARLSRDQRSLVSRVVGQSDDPDMRWPHGVGRDVPDDDMDGPTTSAEEFVAGVEGTRRVEQALRAADRGEAYHWPTIAARLAAEVRRLRAAAGEQRCIDPVDAVLPLFTVERERAADLQRKVDAVEALCNEWAQEPARLQSTTYASIQAFILDRMNRAALSDPEGEK